MRRVLSSREDICFSLESGLSSYLTQSPLRPGNCKDIKYFTTLDSSFPYVFTLAWPFLFSPNYQEITHELPLLGNTSCSAASTCRSLESGSRLLLRAQGLRHRSATLGQGIGKAPERRNLSGVQAARALFSGPEASPKQTGGLLEWRVGVGCCEPARAF